MTPQEKAKELVDKFNAVEDLKGRKIIHFIIDAKQCALIAVDEILDNNSNISDSDKLNHKYWFEVKQEIELL